MFDWSASPAVAEELAQPVGVIRPSFSEGDCMLFDHLLLHRTAYLFCFIMPFGFADVMGWATPFAAGLVAYTFFGLDTLSEELEEPFGTSPNDLPIQALARGIEITLRSALDEPDLPDPVRPVDHLLF